MSGLPSLRVVHLADLHIGFRQFRAQAPNLVNQRELDVAETLVRVIDRVIALKPDLVAIAGDVFHSSHPTNSALVHLYFELRRLREALPGTPVVIAAGNHDTPRADHGSILHLLVGLGVNVAVREARRFQYPELELSVLAVPDAGEKRPPLVPDPDFAHNLLVLHGEIRGVIPCVSEAQRLQEIDPAELNAESWSYVALGHFHVEREIRPNAYYSGSIDYTSFDPWGEAAEEARRGLPGKGFIERDLVTGAHTFHAVPGTRPHFELPSIDATGMSPEQITAAIRARVDQSPRPIDDAAVRLVVYELTREVESSLDHRLIREYQRRAVQFSYSTVRPSARARSVLRRPDGKRMTLEELAASYFARRSLPSDVNRTEFAAAAQQYLKQAGENDLGVESVYAAVEQAELALPAVPAEAAS